MEKHSSVPGSVERPAAGREFLSAYAKAVLQALGRSGSLEAGRLEECLRRLEEQGW